MHPGGLWTQPRNQGGAPERRRTGVAPTESPASVASPELDVPPEARPASSLRGRPPRRRGLARNPETNPLLRGGTQGMGRWSHYFPRRSGGRNQHGYPYQAPEIGLQQGKLLRGVGIPGMARELRNSVGTRLEGRNHEEPSHLGCGSTGRTEPIRENARHAKYSPFLGLGPDLGYYPRTCPTTQGQTCGGGAQEC